MNNLQPIIFAGGRGRRLGQRFKAAIPHPEWPTLLDFQVELFAQLRCKPPILLTNYRLQRRWFTRVTRDALWIVDDDEYQGPAVGLYQAKQHIAAETVLLAGVDMPYLTSQAILKLNEIWHTEAVDSLAVESGGFLQCFPSILNVEKLPELSELRRPGAASSVQPGLSQLIRATGKHRVISEQSWQQFGQSSSVFENVNSPAQLEQLLGPDKAREWLANKQFRIGS